MKKFKFRINDSEYEVSVSEIEKNIAEIEVNGTPFTVEIEKQDKTGSPINRKPAGKVTPIEVPSKYVVAGSIKSPLPGVIVKVLVEKGQTVKRGDVILTLESMKMENNILAEENCTIKSILVSAGQSIMQDEVLVEYEGKTSVSAKIEEPKVESKVEPKVATKVILTSVKSPLPGSVFKILVKVGQKVTAGDALLVLESMKMENNILSEKTAVVKAIHVQLGQTVMQDDILIDLE